jgi:hypothetical protein
MYTVDVDVFLTQQTGKMIEPGVPFLVNPKFSKSGSKSQEFNLLRGCFFFPLMFEAEDGGEIFQVLNLLPPLPLTTWRNTQQELPSSFPKTFFRKNRSEIGFGKMLFKHCT